MRSLSRLLFCLFLCMALPAGDPSVAGPNEHQTTNFDFERGKLRNATGQIVRRKDEGNNLHTVWQKIVSKSTPPPWNRHHPGFNKMELEKDGKIAKGRQSLRLTLLEANAAVETFDFIPVDKDHSYRLSGEIKGEGLKGFAASIAVYFYTEKNDKSILLENGKPIQLVTGSATGEFDWRTVSAALQQVPPGAKFAKIRCRVLATGLGFSGIAWFDNIRLAAAPRIEIAIMESGSGDAAWRAGQTLFVGDAPLILRIKATGFRTRVLSARLKITDWRNRTVSSPRVLLKHGEEAVVKIKMPKQVYGFFNVTLAVSGNGRATDQSLVYGRVPRTAHTQRMTYGLDLTTTGHLSPEQQGMLSVLKVGSIRMDLWAADAPSAKELTKVSRTIRPVELVTIFGNLPDEAMKNFSARGMKSSNHAIFFSEAPRDQKLWAEYVARAVGQSLDLADTWMIGRSGDNGFLGKRGLPTVVAAIVKSIGHGLKSPRLVLPAGLEQIGQAVPAGVHAVDYRVSADVSVAQLMRGLAKHSGPSQTWVTLEIPELGNEPDAATEQEALASFARKLIAARVAGAARVYVDAGAKLLSGSTGTKFYYVLRTITDLLGNQPYRGTIRLPGRSVAHLFGSRDRRVAAVWRTEPSGLPDEKVWWGLSLQQIDIMGNPVSGDTPSLKTAIHGVSEMPLLVTGIAADLLDTQMSARLVGGTVDSRLDNQTRRFVFTNRYKDAISGKITLQFPDDYRLRRAKQPFALAPGETFEMSFDIRPAISDVVGEKALTMELDIDGKYRGQLALSPVTYRLASEIRLDVETRNLGGNKVQLLATVTNPSGLEPLSLFLYFRVPGRNARPFMIRNIPPDSSAIRKIVVAKAARTEKKPVWIGVREKGGSRFLNRYILLDGK